MQTAQPTETWSSKIVFLMAAVGAAVGLGNLWKFPYTAGVSGGAAFVIVYLGAVALVAAPIVIAELMIGRRGRKSPPGSFGVLAAEARVAAMRVPVLLTMERTLAARSTQPRRSRWSFHQSQTPLAAKSSMETATASSIRPQAR